MSKSLFQRAAALSLSAVLTLAMLGSIDHLAQRDEASLMSLMSLQPVAAQTLG